MEAPIGEPGLEPVLSVGRTQVIGLVEPASPAFTGLLVAAAMSLALVGAMSVATSIDALPRYLQVLAEKFWLFLGGTLGLGGLCALIGFFVGRPPSGPKPAKTQKKKAGKGKKGKKGEADEAGLPEEPA
jgi:hypothetical protein